MHKLAVTSLVDKSSQSKQLHGVSNNIGDYHCRKSATKSIYSLRMLSQAR